jgi:multicomponent Na+:H+ antiporter subunit E
MNVILKWKIARTAITAGYLFVGWVLFTGSVNPPSAIMGVIFSAVIAVLTSSVFIEETEAARRFLLPHAYLLPIYIGLVLFKIYVASFRMVQSIITGDVNPRIVHFRTRLKADTARLVLASSITLTPGTITLDLDEDHIIVHWLNAKTRHSHYAGWLIKHHFEVLLRRIWV